MEFMMKEIDGKIFKLVPTTSNLWVSEDAEVYKGDKKLKPFKNSNGYIRIGHYISGLSEYRHRLVAMAWKELPDNYLELEVNHLNNTPGDDWNSNLEWGTTKDNSAHAKKQYRLRNSPLYYKKGLFGDITEALSYADLKKETNCAAMPIRRGLRRAAVHVHPSGYIFSKDHDALLDKTSYTNRELIKCGTVLVRFLNDDREDILATSPTAFGDTKEAQELGLGTGPLYKLLKKNGSSVKDGITIFFVLGGSTYLIPRPEDGEVHDFSLRAKSKVVYVQNVLTNEIKEYPTIRETSRETGIERSAIISRLYNKDLRPARPYYRVTDVSKDIFPKELSAEDILYICRFVLKDSSGNEIISGRSVAEYAEMIRELELESFWVATKDIAKHVSRIEEKGYTFEVYIGEENFTSKLGLTS